MNHTMLRLNMNQNQPIAGNRNTYGARPGDVQPEKCVGCGSNDMKDRTDHERLFACVEEFFIRSGQTEWPTVRQAARSLRWTQTRVEEAAEGHPDARLFTSGYNTENIRPGDLFVESI